MATSVMLASAPRTGRVSRRPQHRFYTRTRPWQLQPFMLAPVLPGETMQNLLLQCRAVTDPIKNPIMGWWKEFYFFYVKHRDLDGRDDFTEMHLDLAKDLSSYNSAADAKYYHGWSTINWAQLCLKRVVEEYFRNEGEAWDIVTIDGLPVSSVNENSWLDSVIERDAYDAPEIDLSDVGSPGGTSVLASEIETALRTWEYMSTHGLTPMSFEDYLRTHGVATARVEPHKPELIRYVRDWSYPSNTVDPETGIPASAVSWSIRERADKARFFSEPGFIIGIQCTRPKVYLSGLSGNAAHLLVGALPWLPAVMANDPRSSLMHVADATGPFTGGSDGDGYVVDIKDLFLYGDQFINEAAGTIGANFAALPTAALQKRYAQASDAIALFQDDGTGELPGTAIHIRSDGVVSLDISGKQVDTTPSQSSGSLVGAGPGL